MKSRSSGTIHSFIAFIHCVDEACSVVRRAVLCAVVSPRIALYISVFCVRADQRKKSSNPLSDGWRQVGVLFGQFGIVRSKESAQSGNACRGHRLFHLRVVPPTDIHGCRRHTTGRVLTRKLIIHMACLLYTSDAADE